MKAVMYGGGNIGRGFIGALFSQSNYEVTFVDVADAVVDELNKRHSYPLRIISNNGSTDITVSNVQAVNGKDMLTTAKAISEADIMATAVGVNILKFIVPNLVAGLRLRMTRGNNPFNIIICENLMDANKYLEKLIVEQLTKEEQDWFYANVGLVESSIGRMVPIQTDEMKDGDPLRVCVEAYGFLPVDKDAFKGEIPKIKNLVPASSFDFYLKRKLYIHNMGHATCAYLGDLLGLDFIYKAIDRDEIYIIVRKAMEESARGLSRKYNTPLNELLLHIDDLLYRFTNKELQDTCKRVGNDPTRKLSPNDRLIGAAALASEMGVVPAYISIGIAAGLNRYISENADMEQNIQNAEMVLSEVSKLDRDSDIFVNSIQMYQRILQGESLKSLRLAAEQLHIQFQGNVI